MIKISNLPDNIYTIDRFLSQKPEGFHAYVHVKAKGEDYIILQCAKKGEAFIPSILETALKNAGITEFPTKESINGKNRTIPNPEKSDGLYELAGMGLVKVIENSSKICLEFVNTQNEEYMCMRIGNGIGDFVRVAKNLKYDPSHKILG